MDEVARNIEKSELAKSVPKIFDTAFIDISNI